ncbi:MAG: transporter substrate-binding domain-containing protein, partial [Kiritimatiellaceae bacterium]|nr:transporter substrate-binding domain-containing protein [Kiritimatiellaceae bacterium]
MKKWVLALLALAIGSGVIADMKALPRGLKHANKQGLQIDLDKIKERGFIRVLTRNNPACYFMHRGQLLGFEYEIVNRFAKKHGLEVLVIVPENWNEMGQWLQEGRADLIAATVTITPNRWDNNRDLKFC